MASGPDDPSISLRESESAVWALWGVEPRERVVEIDRPPRRIRVHDVGSGPPVLLVHGAGGYGPYWAPLVAELSGYRCVMLDRPGWGGSDPADYTQMAHRDFAADLMVDVLDELGIEKAHAVGASIGDVWALALASKHPERVVSVALLGAGPLTDDVDVHLGIRLLRSPLGVVMSRARWRERMETGQARRSGHGPALDDGRMPRPYVDWKVDMTNRTRWRVHERALLRTIVGRRGWKPGLTFDAVELSSLSVPVRMVCGTNDPGFDANAWKSFIAQIPDAALDVQDGAGHLPWFDDPRHVADALRAHFERAAG